MKCGRPLEHEFIVTGYNIHGGTPIMREDIRCPKDYREGLHDLFCRYYYRDKEGNIVFGKSRDDPAGDCNAGLYARHPLDDAHPGRHVDGWFLGP